jgi:hypothetical protein
MTAAPWRKDYRIRIASLMPFDGGRLRSSGFRKATTLEHRRMNAERQSPYEIFFSGEDPARKAMLAGVT